MKIKRTNMNIIMLYYLSLIPLLLYGTYKNGILLFSKHLITFNYLLKPLFLVLISILISYLITYIYNKFVLKEENSLNLTKNSYIPLFIGIITLTMPISIKIIYYLIGVVIITFIANFLKIKKINIFSIFKLLIIILLICLNKYTYLNIFEQTNELSLTIFDLLIGRSIGGIGTTSTIFMGIGFIIMLLIPSYKRDIPLFALLGYFILMIINLPHQSFILSFKNMLNSEFLFGIIFVATMSYYSPLKELNSKAYGFFIGILSFLLYNILPIDSVFIAILVVDLLRVTINIPIIIRRKKRLKE